MGLESFTGDKNVVSKRIKTIELLNTVNNLSEGDSIRLHTSERKYVYPFEIINMDILSDGSKTEIKLKVLTTHNPSRDRHDNPYKIIRAKTGSGVVAYPERNIETVHSVLNVEKHIDWFPFVDTDITDIIADISRADSPPRVNSISATKLYESMSHVEKGDILYLQDKSKTYSTPYKIQKISYTDWINSESNFSTVYMEVITTSMSARKRWGGAPRIIRAIEMGISNNILRLIEKEDVREFNYRDSTVNEVITYPTTGDDIKPSPVFSLSLRKGEKVDIKA